MGRIRDIWNTAMGRSELEGRAFSLHSQFVTGESISNLQGTGTLATSLQSVPLYAAMRLIADSIAATPLHAFREDADGARVKIPDPTFLRPITGGLAAWKTQLVMSLMGYGNAYGYITGYNGLGLPEAIVWLNPTEIWCDENILRPRYQYQGQDIPEGRLLHVPWVVLPGSVSGLSPIGLFATTLQTGNAAQMMARDTYLNGGVPIGHMKNTEKDLGPEEAEILDRRFRAAMSRRKTLITGKDWDYHAIGLPADQLQFIESLQLTATQIASIFGVSPEDIGGSTGKSMTYNTVEMNDIKLSGRTLRPYYVRIEEALSAFQPEREYVKFNADALVRADLKTRMEAHEIALRTGVETLSEARALEDRPPLSSVEVDEFLARYAVDQKRQLTAPEAIAKTYLGVGTVVDSHEAREIVNKFGAELPDAVPDFDVEPSAHATDSNWDDYEQLPMPAGRPRRPQ